MIPVTKTFLPPKTEYQAILDRAWDTGWITNRGVLVRELEEKLKDHLKVPNLIATTNGTIALQIAIKALELSGEIITTPFSYVATISSIVWENCTPVFVDIHHEYLTIDETKIEDAITTETSAILATHVFGNPCEVNAIEAIAKNHNLKVIYDAAHCFGVKYKGESIFNYGDVSICSFHATKVFHTAEGGAIFSSNRKLHESLYFHHNFGHNGPDKFCGLGINAKMSELQAAMGLAVLKYVGSLILERKRIFELYFNFFNTTERVAILTFRPGTIPNFSYFPIIFKSEDVCLRTKSKLEEKGIFPRRYFYPSLNLMEYVKGDSCPISESYSKRVLCLPVYYKLDERKQKEIINIINGIINE